MKETNPHVIARQAKQEERIAKAGFMAFNSYNFPTVIRLANESKRNHKRVKLL